MRQLERRGMGSTLVLSRLSREDIGVWMDGASPEVVTSIYRHTEGNPFFVLETQRALCEAGELRLEESGWVATAPPADLPVPDSVRQVIEMRLSRLSAEVRRTLEAAAVVGRAFDLDVLARIRGQSEETMLEGLDELLRRRLVREGSGFFGKDYEFTHHLLREVVGERLDEARRRWLHGEVAEALVTLRSEEPAIDAEVAYHYIRAEDWGRAQTHLFRAGDHAAGVAADAEALRYYRRAMETYDLQSLGGGEEALLRRAILEHRMGECFFRRGEYEEALRHLKEALTVLGRPLPASKKAMRRATVGALMRQLGHRLVPFWPRTGSLDRNPAAVREEVDIYTFIGWIYALLAEHEAYLLVVLRALNASRRVGYARGEAVAAAALGTGLDFVPLFRVAGACHGRALNRAKRVEDVGAIGFVTQGLAYHSYLIGEEDAALDYARRSADAYQEAGDAHRWAVATLLMVYVHEHRGEFHRALAYARSLMEAGRETADQRTLCAGEEALGIIRLRQGHLKVAADHLRRTVALAEEIPDHMILVEARGELGRCMLQRGSWREAVGLLEATHRIADEHRVGGDSLGRFLNAMAGAYLVAVERDDEGSRADWLERARSACHAALKQSKGYRAGRPEAMRLRGTYEWLMGQPGAARRWWRRSRELADAMGHRYDRALTDLEMGARLGDEVLLQRAADRLDEIGAGWHVARAQRLLDRE
jgi:tetratricopeptide (TPR) repeat protein